MNHSPLSYTIKGSRSTVKYPHSTSIRFGASPVYWFRFCLPGSFRLFFSLRLGLRFRGFSRILRCTQYDMARYDMISYDMVLYDSTSWLSFIPTPHPTSQSRHCFNITHQFGSRRCDRTLLCLIRYDTMYTPANSPLTSFINIPSSRVLIQTPIRHHKR